MNCDFVKSLAAEQKKGVDESSARGVSTIITVSGGVRILRYRTNPNSFD